VKKNRHELILNFIKNNNVSTQDEIIKMLSEHGFNVTQATISRDIKELKLIKEHFGKNEVKYAVSNNSSPCTYRKEPEYEYQILPLLREKLEYHSLLRLLR
jgi:arginine repressor